VGWTSAARQAAAAEYGRQNWRAYAARRRLAVTVGLLAAAGLVAVRVVGPHWRPEYGWWALAGVAGLVVAVVVVRLAWALFRPYGLRRY
jgi:divalent metal cation (Fe/Co/Zn/Cd) transporter